MPATCWLFAYFLECGTEGLHLAWSGDGLQWKILGGQRSYLRPSVGEERLMRDPFLMCGPDGLFRLLWTTGWRGQTIGYAWSKDLLTWSKQRAIPVMAHEPEAVNCWAPEMIWDDANQHYLIFWSTTIRGLYPETALSNRNPERNHRIYATTTRDFLTFTPTRLLYDGGFNVIDATMARSDDGYLMFVKNETVQPKTEKNIRLVHARTPEGPFSDCSAPITGAYWAEGPSAIRFGDEWRVYFDKHRDERYGMVRSRDLVTWEDRSDLLDLPLGARHGSFLAVPGQVVEHLRVMHPSAQGAGGGATR